MKLKPSGEKSPSDIQEFLKRELNPSLNGYDELISDINKSLRSFLASVVVKDLKAKGIKDGSIEIDLHLIKSSSNLTNMVALAFQDMSVGGYFFKFTKPQMSFEKNYDGAWFDKEAFINDLRNKENFDEDTAIKKADELERRFRKGMDLRKGLAQIFGNAETYNRKYVRDLTKYFKHATFNALVIFLVDDFTTSGTTLDQMEQNVRGVLSVIEKSLVYKISLFSKK